ncbi:MAG: LPXTG cell wall anchor domain-containing protein, partial [Lachnospiraceae bacterium]|nr:LPXTG cell wall anchor domain-containing protein [Lachnospiraceae bacterium]
ICGKEQTKDLPVLDHVDKDKDEECDVCGADLDNAKTGDMIMISVVIMVLAAAAIVVLLLKKRREV